MYVCIYISIIPTPQEWMHQYGSMSHVESWTRESNQNPTSTLKKNRMLIPTTGFSEVHVHSCRPNSNSHLLHEPNCPTSHIDGSGAATMSRRLNACFQVVGSSPSTAGSSFGLTLRLTCAAWQSVDKSTRKAKELNRGRHRIPCSRRRLSAVHPHRLRLDYRDDFALSAQRVSPERTDTCPKADSTSTRRPRPLVLQVTMVIMAD